MKTNSKKNKILKKLKDKWKENSLAPANFSDYLWI